MPSSAPHLETLAKLCDEQGMRPKVSQTLPFTDEGVQAAFHALNPPKSERRGAAGKIVISVVPPEEARSGGGGDSGVDTASASTQDTPAVCESSQANADKWPKTALSSVVPET